MTTLLDTYRGTGKPMEAFTLADELKKFPMYDDIEDFGPKILELFKGASRGAWRMLDEKPGMFGYMKDRHYMIRCVRNTPEWGHKLLKNLK